MSSFTANFLKFLGNSTAMMLLFLPAVSAMHEEHSGDDSVITSSSRPSSSVDPRTNLIAGLIREVKVLQAHEADEIDRFIDYVTPEVRTIIAKNLQVNEKILLTLNKLQKNQLTESTALEEISMRRYSFINSRRKNSLTFYQNFTDNPSDRGRVLYGPTDPDIYDLLTPEQQILSTKATDKYQTYNRIILGIASMVDLRTLPANTKRFLRGSPTLCSLLEDSSKGFGHPDETFIFKAAYKGQMSDWEYLTTHLLHTEKVELEQYSSFHKQEKTITVPPYEKKFLNPNWQHPYVSYELPYPDFLKPYPSTIPPVPTLDDKCGRSERIPLITSYSSASSSEYIPSSIESLPSEPLEEVHKPADFLLRPETPEEASLPVAGENSMALPFISTDSSSPIEDQSTIVSTMQS